MTNDTETPDDNSFAEFEAKANAPDDEAPEVKAAEPDVDPGDDESPADEDPEVNDKADDKDGDDKHERRSKPAHKRIGEITAARREAERERDEARAELAALKTGKPADEPFVPPAELKAPDPNDDKYEFGEADPKYLADLMDYKVEVKVAEGKAVAEAEQQKAKMIEVGTKLDAKFDEQSLKATERYADFEDTMAEYKAEQPCPPFLAIAIAASDVGADVVYHLAKNPKENAELARLTQTDPFEAARRFGRLEARFEAQTTKPVKPTNAPEPPAQRARGGSGQFAVSGDTSDFAAFERANSGKR